MRFSKRIIPLTLALSLMAPLCYPQEAQAKEEAGPDWINKGSGIYKSDRGRIIWGVGVANYTTQKALLRMQADDAARSSIATVMGSLVTQIIDSYTASQSADNQSSDTQAIQSQLRDYVNQKLVSSVIVDRFQAADGTMYALAELNWDNMEDMQSVMEKELADFNQRDTLATYDKMAQAIKPSATMAVKEDSPSVTQTKNMREAAAKADNSSKDGKKAKAPRVKIRKNKREPDWVNGQSATFPNSQYLCGVGIGANRQSAEDRSFDAISRVFSAKVKGESNTYLASVQRSGQAEKNTTVAEQQTRISTETILRGVQVREMYAAKKGDTYVLSCLERAPIALELKQEIKRLDDKAAGDFQHAQEQKNRLDKIKQLNQCANTLLERSLYNSQLRIIDADGIGVASSLIYADIEEALEKAQETFNVVISMEGDESDSVNSALTTALNKKGFQVLDPSSQVIDGSADGIKVHLLVKAILRMEDAGMGGPGGAYYIKRAVMPVTLQNGETGKDIISFEISEKQGHSSAAEAERKAIRELSKKVIKRLGSEMDKYLAQ